MSLVRDLTVLSRRELLKLGLAVSTNLVVGASFVTSSNAAWAVGVKTLQPHTMATLVQMARDIYPHDSFGDEIYANAIKDYDTKAAKDENLKDLIEVSIASLDKLAADGGDNDYLSVGWEKDRVALLESIESTEFFQMLRGGLVIGVYNNKDVWEILGYEGESFSKGGYLQRGFDSVNWL